MHILLTFFPAWTVKHTDWQTYNTRHVYIFWFGKTVCDVKHMTFELRLRSNSSYGKAKHIFQLPKWPCFLKFLTHTYTYTHITYNSSQFTESRTTEPINKYLFTLLSSLSSCFSLASFLGCHTCCASHANP